MNRVEEPARESFLYYLWQNRSFKEHDLKTLCGKKVEVLEKGKQNYDAGPDFLNALLRIDGDLYRGDVEIHSVAGDWYAHGHHTDPRYNSVLLHVVTMNCKQAFITRCENGKTVPILNLDYYLEKAAKDLESYSEHQNLSVTNEIVCALADKSITTIRYVLEQMGRQRLILKVNRILEKRDMFSWNQLFFLNICEALGYSKNQIPFRRLAAIVPVETLWEFIWNDPSDVALLKTEAVLFGAAGFFSRKHKWVDRTEPYVIKLIELWNLFPFKQKIDILHPEIWQFFRLRPNNFPTRRIAAAAAFVCLFLRDGFVTKLTDLFEQERYRPRLIVSELERLFQVKANRFWKNHFSFNSIAPVNPGMTFLIGRERARDIILNVVIPGLIAYAHETDNRRLKNTVRDIYLQYPLCSDNEITRPMRQQLFGHEKGGKKCVDRGCIQQGMIHLRTRVCQPKYCNRCLEDFAV